MGTYIIRIQLQPAGKDAYRVLDVSMKKENFTPAETTKDSEKTFFYYGNQDLLYVNEAVQRAALSTGNRFSFTVIKDKRTEKQYHVIGKNA